jgi:hypothetical protein
MLKGLGGNADAFVDEPEQKVLRTHKALVEEPCFLLGQDKDAPASVGEAFEHELRVMADRHQRKG